MSVCEIVRFEIIPFQYDLIGPLKIGNQTINNRRGLYLQIVDDKGNMGIGEYSPLPGLHTETDFCVPDPIKSLEGGFKIHHKNLNLGVRGLGVIDPHLSTGWQFACEGMLLNYFLKCSPSLFEELFFPKAGVLINGLYVPKKEDLSRTRHIAEEINGANFKALKIKIGRINRSHEIELLNRLFSKLHKSISIRLDGNGSFTPNDLESYLSCINTSDINIEYIEEPFKSFENIRSTDLPIAQDESLLSKGALVGENISAHIIKPQSFGVSESLKLIDNAVKNSIKPIISSCFESHVGMWTLMVMANYVNQKAVVPAGLDTLKYIKGMESKFFIKDGHLIIN